jgi:hypothetical protein
MLGLYNPRIPVVPIDIIKFIWMSSKNKRAHKDIVIEMNMLLLAISMYIIALILMYYNPILYWDIDAI